MRGRRLVAALTPLDKEHIVAESLAGTPNATIARSFGFKSTGPIRKILVAAGLTTDNFFNPSQTQIRQIAARYEVGESAQSIARSFGRDVGVIRRTLLEAGTTIREARIANGVSAAYRQRRLPIPVYADIQKRTFTGHARRLTNLVYSEYLEVINPRRLVRGRSHDSWHVDHAYSVFFAYHNPGRLKNPVNIWELCHPANLRMVRTLANLHKSRRIEYTAKELRQQINEWNLKYGEPYFCNLQRFSTYEYVAEIYGRPLNFGSLLRETRGSYYKTSDCV